MGEKEGGETSIRAVLTRRSSTRRRRTSEEEMGRRKGKSKKDSKWSGTDHTRRSETARCAIIGNSYFSALGFVMNDIAFRIKMIFFFFFWKNVRAKFLLLNWAIYPGQEGRGESLGNFFYSWIFSFFARINSHPVKFSPFLFLYKHHKCLKLIANHEVENIRMRIFEKIRYFENFKN